MMLPKPIRRTRAALSSLASPRSLSRTMPRRGEIMYKKNSIEARGAKPPTAIPISVFMYASLAQTLRCGNSVIICI